MMEKRLLGLILFLIIFVVGCVPAPTTVDEYFKFYKTSDHFIAHYPKEQEKHVDIILCYAEEAYRELKFAFPKSNISSFEVWIYSSTKDFNKLLSKNFPDWINGTTQLDGKAMALINIKTLIKKKTLGRLIKHELAHLFILEAADYSIYTIPNWLNEGLAQYLAFEGYMDSHIFVEAIKKNKLIPLKNMNTFFSNIKSEENLYLSYCESLSIVEYMVETYGFEKIRQLLYLRGKGVILEDAFPQIFGVEYNKFKQDWKDYLKRKWLESNK